MKFVLFLLPFIILMNGCAFSKSPHLLTNSQTPTDVLIQEQIDLIDAQSQRLDAIAGAHDTLLEQISSMQTQISAINQKVTPGSGNRSHSAHANKKSVQSGVPLASARDASSVFGMAILGRVEFAWLDGVGQYLKARIDTGAKSSSLNATNIQRFERNGKRWVRFDVALDDTKKVTLEAPLHRHVRIRQASVDDLERRPVVRLPIRMGEIYEETEFSLSDRNEMLYPILLGRSFLRDIAIVDVAKKFTRSRDPKLAAQVSP
ncbi:MAG: ATP-dependent zinc protease [Agarilytica sp.]